MNQQYYFEPQQEVSYEEPENITPKQKKRKLKQYDSKDEVTQENGNDSSRWGLMFRALLDYGKEKCHYNAPINCESVQQDGTVLMLGTWLSTQRQLMRKGKLRPDRQKKLQALVDMGKLQWVMPSIASHDDEKWNATFELLKSFGANHGHFHVPCNYECNLPDGRCIKLGKWLCKQREQKRNGCIRSDREALLQGLVESNNLKMPCTRPNDEDDWLMMYDFLLCFAEEYKHCFVPFNYEFPLGDGTTVKLGIWLSIQRQLHSRDSLRPDREAELQKLVDAGMMCWDPPNRGLNDGRKWAHMLDVLLRYGEEQKDYQVPSNYDFHVGDGTVIKLGAWLSQQRHLKKKGRLLPDRESKLQELVDTGKLRWGRNPTDGDN